MLFIKNKRGTRNKPEKKKGTLERGIRKEGRRTVVMMATSGMVMNGNRYEVEGEDKRCGACKWKQLTKQPTLVV